MPKRSTPDWTAWWNEVLRRVDASESGRVRLTIEEIRAGSRCDNRQKLDYVLWWLGAKKEHLPRNDVGLRESELDWDDLDVVNGDVVAVSFTRKK
jgi:hypothetical protein